MLDLARIREDPEGVRMAVARKGARHAEAFGPLLEADALRRESMTRLEHLRHGKRELSKAFAQGDAAAKEAARAESKAMDGEIAALEDAAKALDARIEALLLDIPNAPVEGCPDGPDATGNVELRRFGEKPAFSFQPMAHWDLGESLGLLDPARGARIAGSGFPLYVGWGARLERALLNFMLDLHVKEHGYTEAIPPVLVQRASMVTTGQLPKFEHDMYRLEQDDLFLIPTAEVPLTNIHRDEILDEARLPLRYTAYTPCFRREAGAAGKDTRGLTRIHQFNKVELMTFASPERSVEEHEALTRHAETVLQRLGLHYRVVHVCTGDMGFSNLNQYDLELYAPGMDRWLEVSSCSNFGDYQARRGAIRCRKGKDRPRFAHTLNGSGTATPRLFIALVETFQQADGAVLIPKPLQPYLGTDRISR